MDTITQSQLCGMTDGNCLGISNFDEVGDVTVSIQEVAAKAGVSVSTVGRAFTNPGRVSAKTREHVLSVASRMGYRVSRSASALKSGQSLRVALLMNESLANWFNGSVLSGLNTVLQTAGYDISIYEHIDDAATRRAFFTELPVRRNADAVVVASFAIEPEETEQLQTLNVPIVGINVPSTVGFDASVSIDDQNGMYIATRHLIQLGHRNLAYLCSELPETVTLSYSIDRRLFGFEEACQAAEFTVLSQVIPLPRNQNQAVESALSQLLTLDQFPTGVCCQSDNLAIPLCQRLQQIGKAIPVECSVVGFDDAAGSEAFGLTTMRQRPFDMAIAAAHKVLELIAGKDVGERHEVAPTEFVARRTSSAPQTYMSQN